MAESLMTHMVAYYPDRDRSLEVAKALVDGGASYLEIQFPFSDPSADGPVIQSACTRALEAGFRVDDGFALVREISRFAGRPIFVMSYASLVFARRIERFIQDVREAGATGVIIPDLPIGYDEGLFDCAEAKGIEVAAVVSPAVQEERLAAICGRKANYLYASLRTGITGRITPIDEKSLSFLKRIGAYGKRILAGFGVATHEQVKLIAPYVHAVVVGTALLRCIEEANNKALYPLLKTRVEELAGRSIQPACP
jgi:tryptophan synthase alpha chain